MTYPLPATLKPADEGATDPDLVRVVVVGVRVIHGREV
jgi:hypothetical protein